MLLLLLLFVHGIVLYCTRIDRCDYTDFTGTAKNAAPVHLDDCDVFDVIYYYYRHNAAEDDYII